MKCGSFLRLNMIAQLNSYPEQAPITRSTLRHNYPATLQNQIKIIETSNDGFATEIVADALKLAVTGQRVLIVQLLKGGIRQGHDRVMNISVADLNDLESHNFQQLWKHVRAVAKTREYSHLILDDLSLSIDLGLISLESATSFLTTLPEDLQVILTGTNPHPAIAELGDRG
jgi:cob(I)alamin adenosyltransferase